MKRNKLYDEAIRKYGPESQVRMLMEEMGELQVAVCKSMRTKQADSEENKKLIMDEIADVEIMIEQMKVLYDIDSKEYTIHKRYKKRRLQKRLEKI